MAGYTFNSVQDYSTNGNDVIRNSFQSNVLHPPDQTKVHQRTNSSPHTYERLRRLPELSGHTAGSVFLPPPGSKHLTRPSFLPETVCNEPDKESCTSDGTAGPSPSLSSDEDLRAIKVELEELLEPDRRETCKEPWSRPESETTLPVHDGTYC